MAPSCFAETGWWCRRCCAGACWITRTDVTRGWSVRSSAFVRGSGGRASIRRWKNSLTRALLGLWIFQRLLGGGV